MYGEKGMEKEKGKEREKARKKKEKSTYGEEMAKKAFFSASLTSRAKLQSFTMIFAMGKGRVDPPGVV